MKNLLKIKIINILKIFSQTIYEYITLKMNFKNKKMQFIITRTNEYQNVFYKFESSLFVKSNEFQDDKFYYRI